MRVVWCDGARACFPEIAGVAGVLAGGPIRDYDVSARTIRRPFVSLRRVVRVCLEVASARPSRRAISAIGRLLVAVVACELRGAPTFAHPTGR